MLLPGSKCPTCKHGALKTARDLERGHCDACYMINGGLKADREAAKPMLEEFARRFPVVASHSPTWPYRTDLDAYGEGLHDDD